MRPYWDDLSMFLYVVMGIVSMLSLKFALANREKNQAKAKFYLGSGIIIWTIFASFRLVAHNIGGSDAITYVGYFDMCLSGAKVFPYSDHMDWLMGVIIKAIRFCTSSQYVFFLVVYGFMAWAYYYFCYSYAPKKSSPIAYFLLFFLYLRSFSSLRSNFCIAVILLGLVALRRLKEYKVYLLTFSAVLIHKVAVIYAMVLPFIKVFSKRKLSVPVVVGLIAVSSVLATILQTVFLANFADVDLGGSYQSYASHSLESGGFFENEWKIAFEQMALGFFMLINIKSLRERWQGFDAVDQKRIQIIYLICIFDFMLIPVNYIMGIWRGYEMLYAPRLVMWGEVIAVSFKSKQYLRIIYLIALIYWLIFRVDRTYEESCLMPYIFEPFMYI